MLKSQSKNNKQQEYGTYTIPRDRITAEGHGGFSTHIEMIVHTDEERMEQQMVAKQKA